MADLLTPALFDRLLWAAVGAAGASLVIAVATGPRRRRSQRRDLDPALWGPWHESPSGASGARNMARVAMETWERCYGPMSAMQAITYAAEILSSDNVTGWTDGLDAVRLNVVNLARRVAAAHQHPSGGREKPRPHGGRLIQEGQWPDRNGAGGMR